MSSQYVMARSPRVKIELILSYFTLDLGGWYTWLYDVFRYPKREQEWI